MKYPQTQITYLIDKDFWCQITQMTPLGTWLVLQQKTTAHGGKHPATYIFLKYFFFSISRSLSISFQTQISTSWLVWFHLFIYFCPYQMVEPDQCPVRHWTGSNTWSHNGTQVGSVGPNGQRGGACAGGGEERHEASQEGGRAPQVSSGDIPGLLSTCHNHCCSVCPIGSVVQIQ